MATLGDWKSDSKAGRGWPVEGITDDTHGMKIGDVVIYYSEGKVRKSDGTLWGTFDVPNDQENQIVGKVADTTWSFRITCPNGRLRGDLFETPVTTFHRGSSHHSRRPRHDHSHSQDGHDTDPSPGTWTTAEGGGHHFERRGRRRKQLDA